MLLQIPEDTDEKTVEHGFQDDTCTSNCHLPAGNLLRLEWFDGQLVLQPTTLKTG